MFCPNCGTKLEGGEAFCPNRGERLEIQTEEATYQGENNFDEDRTVQLNDSVPYPGRLVTMKTEQ
ncbi:MAG: zinc ribbon domain-containing protein [Blautia sp.]